MTPLIEIKIRLDYRKPRPVIRMKRPEFMRINRKCSAEQLRTKFWLGEAICGWLARNPTPGGIEAIKQLQNEMEWLRELVEEKERPKPPPEPIRVLTPAEAGDEGKPPAQVILLKTLRLHSQLNK